VLELQITFSLVFSSLSLILLFFDLRVRGDNCLFRLLFSLIWCT